jgi:hypothetical protein
MTGGLALAYAQARLQSRYGARAGAPLWNQVRSAQSFGVALETLRASRLAPWVAAIAADAGADDVELALRQAFRETVAETARWLPAPWSPAFAWAALAVDLPAVVHLAAGEAPWAWMRRDAVLSPCVDGDADARRAALRRSAFGPVVAAIGAAAPRAGGADSARAAWGDEWRRRWPRTEPATRAGLEGLLALVERHLAAFAAATAGDPWTLRRDLERAVAIRFRRHAFTPAAAFAYLLLVALDLERLRAHLALRAAFGIVP